jgi:prepilin-type N-terminal cleavage/methylation domain-containing protein
MTTERGFSLIELMVAITLFAVVMLVSVGALLSLVDANRKARSLESVMNNLNIAVDGMVRSIRMGNTYNCNATAVPAHEVGGDCGLGADLFSFAPFGSNPDVQTERWVYYFEEGAGESGGRLLRSRTGNLGDAVAITAPEVNIEDVTFYVDGTIRANTLSQDKTQPKVVMVIKGTAGAGNAKTETTFYIQATAVQRVLDL